MRRSGRFALLTAAILLGSSAAAAAPGDDGSVRFAAAGDFSTSSNAGAVLSAMSASGADLAVALGDLSYGVTGQEQLFCDFVTDRLGDGFPFELLAGNHESNGQNGNINDFAACLPNQLPGVVGTYGRQYYVDVPAEDPLVRYVMISPAIPFPDGLWSYDAGTPRYAWTAAAIDGARAADIPWVVVGMHKPCLSAGTYGCEPGADITDLMLSKGVDLVLNGHEHLYQRTKQIGLGPGCPTLTIGTYDAACVTDADADMTAGAGTVFATIGSGGVSPRNVNLSDPEAGYFAALMGANANQTFGFLDVAADRDSLTAQFVRGSGGTFTDSFTLTKGVAPPNQPPVAAFTSTSSGLTAAFDARGSSDPDGVVAAHTWDFGDGTTGTGATPSHAYAAAGTYPVTVTVTDDDGATDSETASVTVSAPPGPTVLVRDAFERTVPTGWGSAVTGGPWTTTGGAAAGVDAGTGRLTNDLNATPLAYLGFTLSTDVDVRVDVTLDRVPAGGTAGSVQMLQLRRIFKVGDYRVKVQVAPGGAVRATLSRTASNGLETAISPTVAVPGLTYTAGTRLAFRGQATGTNPTALRAKVWRADQPEPAAWTVTTSNAQAELQAPGAVGVSSWLSGGTTNGPVTARWDDLLAVVASTLP